jgi:hypothetical protein
MKCIFDRGFKYVPSVETDLRRTFARIRREQSKKQARNARSIPDGGENIVSLTVPKKAAERI